MKEEEKEDRLKGLKGLVLTPAIEEWIGEGGGIPTFNELINFGSSGSILTISCSTYRLALSPSLEGIWAAKLYVARMRGGLILAITSSEPTNDLQFRKDLPLAGFSLLKEAESPMHADQLFGLWSYALRPLDWKVYEELMTGWWKTSPGIGPHDSWGFGKKKGNF